MNLGSTVPSAMLKQQYIGFDHGILTFERLKSTIMLTFSFPLETCIKKQLVYL